ncbi:hypothetical protein MKZ38_010598 [Zalerion maritima]|uniref:Uncharacterized protein n=1 Tax=Zalerion maritima TaxID=339359 RepID=A0AAD5RTQ9_9PEZI|nr:hypothetical protein MKZ38_010598 [Zalerion maritima]
MDKNQDILQLTPAVILCRTHFLERAAKFHTFQREDIKRRLKELRTKNTSPGKPTKKTSKEKVTPRSVEPQETTPPRRQLSRRPKQVVVPLPTDIWLEEDGEVEGEARETRTGRRREALETPSPSNSSSSPDTPKLIIPFLASISSNTTAPASSPSPPPSSNSSSKEEEKLRLVAMRKQTGVSRPRTAWLKSLTAIIDKAIKQKSETVEAMGGEEEALQRCIWKGRDMSCDACLEEWNCQAAQGRGRKGELREERPDGVDIQGKDGSHQWNAPVTANSKKRKGARRDDSDDEEEAPQKKRKTKNETKTSPLGRLGMVTASFLDTPPLHYYKAPIAPMEASPSLAVNNQGDSDDGWGDLDDLDDEMGAQEMKEVLCIQWKMLSLYVDVCAGGRFAKVVLVA